MIEDKNIRKTHRLVLENRNGCSLSGVKDVASFDLTIIVLETECGRLTVKGSDLHVNKLSLEKGEVDISGNVTALIYSDSKAMKKESFMQRIMG